MSLVRVVIQGANIRIVHDDDLVSELGKHGRVETRRASNAEPYGDGYWQVDLRPVRGPILDGFKTRKSAIAAELAWLYSAGY